MSPLAILITRFLLFAIAGMFNAVMDKLQFHYSKSIFPPKNSDHKLLGRGYDWWNPNMSWVKKYKYDDPDEGERFPLSTSVLVFLTDGWHLMQFFMLSMFTLAATPIMSNIWHTLLAFVALRIAFSATFHLFFHRFLVRKNNGEKAT